MQEFERASLHKDFVNEENNTGSYIFEPLERGFGITIGNTICRTLLTSVPGTRIVGFKVSGFDGKATMIEGILEDIYRISLNLKAVQLYNDGEGFQTLHISKKGPATIQAADIICPEAVEVVDPEQVICTLEKGASLEMEIYAVTGTGYKSSIENKVSYDFGEDVVVLDATFTPIRKADYLAEPARVGLDKKYDKVHINVETDGTITPLQAITMAAKICMENLDEVLTVSDLELEESFMVQKPQVEDVKKVNTMMIEVKNMSFSYGKRKQKVFDDFSLALDKGSVYGLLGKNGTGKSTLLYLMTGLLRPQAGRVLYKGVDVSMRYPLTLQDMFLVPEEFALPSVSLKQYLKLNTPFYPNFSNELLSTCLRDFDMNEDIHLGELSMGQKKKAFMCFALATNTSLLVMDEPSNGLDIPSKSQFRKVIASGMTDEKSVIISTHQVRDIDSLLDHVVIIDGTRVLLNASVKTICDKVYFAEQGMNEPTDTALYVQPSVQGNSVIFPNTENEETNLNLEVLFNAMLAEREKMQTMFNK